MPRFLLATLLIVVVPVQAVQAQTAAEPSVVVAQGDAIVRRALM